jgi:hypothetical protein
MAKVKLLVALVIILLITLWLSSLSVHAGMVWAG